MAITIGGMGPDGKLKREPDAYNKASVGIRPAAHAIGAGVRELPGQVGAGLNTAGQVASGVASSVAPAARGLSHASGTAARNVASTDFQGAGRRLLASSGQAATGVGSAVAGTGAGQYLGRRIMDPTGMARPIAASIDAARAGFAGEPLPPRPVATVQRLAAPSDTPGAAPASRPFAGVGEALANGGRAVAAMGDGPGGLPAAASAGGAAPVTAGGIGTGYRGRGYGVMNTPDGVAAGLANPKRPHGPGASNPNYFVGGNGARQEMRADGSMQPVAGTGGAPAGGLARPVPSVSYMSGAPAASAPSLSLAHPTVQFEGTRASPNPADQRAAILDPRSSGAEMLRRAENAGSEARMMARSKPGTYTRAQLEAASAAAAQERNFWLNQAASIGGDAQARFMQAQGLRSQEGQGAMREGGANARALLGEQGQSQRSAATLAAQQGMSQAGLDAQMQMEQLRQAGADRRATQLAELQRPQQPIVLGDGTMVAIGPNGTLQPYTLPDGSVARAPMGQPTRDYGRESNDRMFTDLVDMQRGPDGTLVPDAVERAMMQMQQYQGGGNPQAMPSRAQAAADLRRLNPRATDAEIEEALRAGYGG